MMSSTRHYAGADRERPAPWVCPTCGGANIGDAAQGCTQEGCAAGKQGTRVAQVEAPRLVLEESDPNAPITDAPSQVKGRLVTEEEVMDAPPPTDTPVPLPAPTEAEELTAALTSMRTAMDALAERVGTLGAAAPAAPEPEPPITPLQLLITDHDGEDVHLLDKDIARTIVAALTDYVNTDLSDSGRHKGLLGAEACLDLITALSVGHEL